jgi:hypothetical protein
MQQKRAEERPETCAVLPPFLSNFPPPALRSACETCAPPPSSLPRAPPARSAWMSVLIMPMDGTTEVIGTPPAHATPEPIGDDHSCLGPKEHRTHRRCPGCDDNSLRGARGPKGPIFLMLCLAGRIPRCLVSLYTLARFSSQSPPPPLPPTKMYGNAFHSGTSLRRLPTLC